MLGALDYAVRRLDLLLRHAGHRQNGSKQDRESHGLAVEDASWHEPTAG